MNVTKLWQVVTEVKQIQSSKKPSKFNYICTGRYSSKHEISIKPSNAIFKELGVKESLIMSDKDNEGMNMNNSIKKFREIRW